MGCWDEALWWQLYLASDRKAAQLLLLLLLYARTFMQFIVAWCEGGNKESERGQAERARERGS